MSRPTAITVFGILNLVFAGLCLLAMGLNLLQVARYYSMQTLPTNTGSPGPIQLSHESFENPLYIAWTVTGFSLQTLGIAFKVVTGVGLLRMRRWARKATIAYAVFVIVVSLVGIVGWVMLMRLATSQVLVPLPGRPMVIDIGANIMAMSWSIMGLFGGCASLIYPIVLIYIMTRMDVRMAFATKPAVVEATPASSPSIVTEESP